MQTVKSLTSYGNKKDVSRTFKVSDFQKFVDERIFDAEMYANHRGGTIYVSRCANVLYLGYFDIPDTDLCDRVYVLKKPD